jgi:hypothetical protein
LDVLTWREIDLGGVVLTGLVAGYVMAVTVKTPAPTPCAASSEHKR